MLLLLKAIAISSEQHYFIRNKSSSLTTELFDLLYVFEYW